MTRPRKRTYFLSDTFQTKFLAVSLFHYSIILLTFVGTLFAPLMIQLDSLSLSHTEKAEFANQFLSLHERLWVPLVVVLGLLTFHSLFFSHRIAGPLFRFRRIFKAVAEGDLTICANIRTNDYLKKEADGLDDMIGSLRTKMFDMQANFEGINGLLNELDRAVTSGSMAEVAQSKKQLSERVDQLKAHLEQFKTCA